MLRLFPVFLLIDLRKLVLQPDILPNNAGQLYTKFLFQLQLKQSSSFELLLREFELLLERSELVVELQFLSVLLSGGSCFCSSIVQRLLLGWISHLLE